MNISFKNLEFIINENNQVLMTKCGCFSYADGAVFAEVQICGQNKPTHGGVRMIASSEGGAMKYVSHTVEGNTLMIEQASALVNVKTYFETYDDNDVIRMHTEVENISKEDQILEEVSSVVISGFGSRGRDGANELFITQFTQSHHSECQPIRHSFDDLGLGGYKCGMQKKIFFANIGSWSTKEALPQAILEDTATGDMAMFQLESNAGWYYEISEKKGMFYHLYMGGPNITYGGWSKCLRPGECYSTIYTAITFGTSLNQLLGDMTKYRRHICGLAPIDRNLPTIFNEYMHLSWDSPSEETTKIYAPVVAKTGVEYYVIDCGWHNEEPGNIIYPYVGQWMESKSKFPSGVRATTDFIRSLGMKAGLWIEPEIIGIKCEDMLKYYDDDCFMQRNGKRLAVMGRHFLDYRNEKVRAYMTETIRRMVEDYGADYIKFDYNQDVGVGTDYLAFCAGEGLEACANAFLDWVKEMTRRFPNTVFEGCASGGMRMDYKSLSAFSLISTSDQVDYLKYPCIAGNILSAVIPEQAAVWSYPVIKGTEINDRQIIMNMINSFLGRMHLASHLERMDEHQLGLVHEGVAFYNTLTEMKKRALPYLPCGFTKFKEEKIASGLKDGKKIALAVWNLGEDTEQDICIEEGIASVTMGYPSTPNASFSHDGKTLHVSFNEPKSAAFFMIETK